MEGSTSRQQNFFLGGQQAINRNKMYSVEIDWRESVLRLIDWRDLKFERLINELRLIAKTFLNPQALCLTSFSEAPTTQSSYRPAGCDQR
jgi:hypothetical protein